MVVVLLVQIRIGRKYRAVGMILYDSKITVVVSFFLMINVIMFIKQPTNAFELVPPGKTYHHL
jgi:hypothetical protein